MADINVATVLNANDVAGAQAIIDTHKQLVAYVKACKSCGIDMDSILAQSQAYADFAAAILKQAKGGDANV